MYYKDLTPAKNGDKIIHGVFYVGWLSKDKLFKKGKVDEEFLKKLKLIFFGNDNYSSQVNLLRAPSRPCDFCGVVVEEHDFERYMGLGCSEIWIKHKEKYYAAPSLIIHYIEAHNYKPPKEYVRAVMAVDLSDSFHAEEEKFTKLIEPESLENIGIIKRIFRSIK